MHFLYRAISIILFIGVFTNLSAQEKRAINAVLLNSKDSPPVAYAHIVNHKSNIWTSSTIKELEDV